LTHATTIVQKALYFTQGNIFSVSIGKSSILTLFSLHIQDDCRAEFGISGN